MDNLFQSLPTSVSLARQIQAVEREVRMRRQVYPNRVADGRMLLAKAHEEIDVMSAVLATLQELAKVKNR